MAAAAARQRGAYCRQIVVRSESLTAKQSEAREHEKVREHARESVRGGTQREREREEELHGVLQASKRRSGPMVVALSVRARVQAAYALTEVPRNLREIPCPLYALNIGEQGPIRVLDAQIKAEDAQ